MGGWVDIYTNNCEPNDNVCIQKRDCHINKTTIIISVCLIIVTAFLLLKLFLETYTNIIDNHKKPITIVYGILILILTGIVSLSPYLNNCQKLNTQTTTPTLPPIQTLNNLGVLFKEQNISPEDAKVLVCNSSSKCTSPDNIYITSFRKNDTSTYVTFVTLEDIDVGDIRTSNIIEQVIKEIPPQYPVQVRIIDYNNYQEPTPKPLVPPTTAPPTIPPLTFPPIDDPNRPLEYISCRNYQWSDNFGNGCDFYNNRIVCNRYGIDPEYSGIISNNECSQHTTESQCQTTSKLGNPICQWQNNQCVGALASASDACCTCGGGHDQTIQFTPQPPTTTAPTTTQPTTTQPIQTTVPVTREPKLVLAVSGLVELGSTGYYDSLMPLYTYNLYNYQVPDSAVRDIEGFFGGKIPTRSGFPRYNYRTGEFEGMPNAIVSREASEIEKPDGIELMTEPVDGLPGAYYLFVRSSACNTFLPAYTQPLSYYDNKYNSSYFTLLGPDGNPESMAKMLGCKVGIDYSCLCMSGTWGGQNQLEISYPEIPQALYENCPTPSPEATYATEIEREIANKAHPYDVKITSTCDVSVDMDRMILDSLKEEYIKLLEDSENNLGIESNIPFIKLLGFDTIDEMRSACPDVVGRCLDDSICRSDLEDIIRFWNDIKELSNQEESRFIDFFINLFSLTQQETQNPLPQSPISIPEVNYTNLMQSVIECIHNYKNQEFKEQPIDCDYLSNYYKTCQFGIEKISTTPQNETNRDILLLMDNLFIKPLCIIKANGRDKEFYNKYTKYLRTMLIDSILGNSGSFEDLFPSLYDLEEHPRSISKYAFQTLNYNKELQKDCCNNSNISTTTNTYRPLEGTVPCENQIMCTIL